MAQIIKALPATSADGFTAECLLCPFTDAGWPTATEAQDVAVWHVYEIHSEQWRALIGDRPPLRPQPRKA